jgi:RING-type zinc-finger/B-box zinc finger
VRDVTKCPICLEDFNDPRSLTCLHTFCLNCLVRHYNDKQPRDEVPCPVCRQEFRIPDNGVQGLRHNFVVDGLLSTTKVSKQSAGENLVECEVCGDEGGNATVYCVDCRQKLCQGCSKPHLKMRGGAHRVVALGEELKAQLLKVRGSICGVHKDAMVKLYCCECNVNICTLCFAVKHRQHECLEIDKASESFRKQIRSDVDKIASVVAKLKQKGNEVGEEKKKAIVKLNKAEVMIKQKGDEIKRLVDSQVNELLQQVREVKSDVEKKMSSIQENIELSLVSMESYVNYAQELISKSTPCDISGAASELHDRADELVKLSDRTADEYHAPDVVFTPTKITDMVNQLSSVRTNLVGILSICSGEL